ncbi:sodium symporter [Haloterrigena salina JCM 13891]|uniref:Sodium symporter n=1 Tax=Haloterrigena salina JCM 13891 TaxID=1227488 RepID=M0C6E2_9EURY|nr:arsenic resistance protein [Haloterrigena salina]ELZ17907.1 sodium symporter [Haloterrigena salina JCM 13891]
MNAFERFQTLFVMAGIAVGLGAAQVSGVPALADRLIFPFLMVMLFASFAGIPLEGLRRAFGNRRVVGSSLAVNFVWNPLLAVALGAVFLADHPALWVGLLMLLVTPCTDWYLIFTDLANGDVPLATSLLPYNLVLQLVLLPVYLYAFAGTLVDLRLGILLEGIALVLVVPLVLAAVARYGLTALRGRRWLTDVFLPKLGPVQIVFLALAVAAMFASQGRLVLERPDVLVLLAAPLLAFYAVNFSLGLAIGRLLDFSYREVACFNCTVLSRNSPTALAIAVVAFPNEPLIALALVIGPLLELPLLSVVANLLRRIEARGWDRLDQAPG